MEFNKMVCLVGENPLPVYLGIKQLSSKNGEVVLVYSKKTKPIAERVRDRIVTTGRTCILNDANHQLLNPYDPLEVVKKLLPLTQPGTALNFTGGTKVMSSFSTLTCLFNGLNADAGKTTSQGSMSIKDIAATVENTFYLEDESGYFHFGGSSQGEELTAEFDLDDLCALHDVQGPIHRNMPQTSLKDRQRMLAYLLDDQKYERIPAVNRQVFKTISDKAKLYELSQMKSTKQYEWFEKQYSTGQWSDNGVWRTCLQLLTEETRNLWLQTKLPETSETYTESDLYGQFRFLIQNLWFEIWVKDCVTKVLGKEHPLLIGQEFIYQGQQFECDLLTVSKHRLRYISITTSSNRGVCKGKIFEAIRRSQQIGGGLARSCVISATVYQDQVDDELQDIVQDLRKSVGEHPKHTVFGKKDVNKWRTGDFKSLTEFLKH